MNKSPRGQDSPVPEMTSELGVPAPDVEQAVRQRYAKASQEVEPGLCCPTQYDPKYLKLIPDEILQKDYGCGDPSRHLRVGEVVLDLGSGAGKGCYIAAQVVGPQGRVIGVDFNEAMLQLARRYLELMAQRLGYANVEFRKGKIQDLRLDLEAFEKYLEQHPVRTWEDWEQAQAYAEHLRRTSPLVPDEAVDVVISNCVLNLVRPEDRQQLFAEMYRVLRPGGRVVISDITSDEPVPGWMKQDVQLWSGCIAGAFQEQEFLQAFEQAGFQAIRILERQHQPWREIEGIQFRSMTVEAFKMPPGPCLDHGDAVIYRGPWRSVTDDAGHTFRRGERTAVCRKTFQMLTQPPYAQDIIPVPALHEVAEDQAPEFECRRPRVRHPRETKGQGYRRTSSADLDCCGPGQPCC